MSQLNIDLPEQVSAGMDASFPDSDSKGVCVFASGAASISAQFAVDASFRSELRVVGAMDGRVPGWLTEGTDAVLIHRPGQDRMSEDVYDALKDRGCRIHCIAPESSITDICRRNGDRLVLTPDRLGGCDSAGFEIGSLSRLFESMGCPSMRESLEAALPRVMEYRDLLLSDPSPAEELARRLSGKVVAVYSVAGASAAAMRWRNSFEEGRSFYGEMTEFDHNEIVGWADPNVHARELELVVLRIGTGAPQLEYTIDSMLAVLEEYGRRATVVRFDDPDMTASELESMVLGDAVYAFIREGL